MIASITPGSKVWHRGWLAIVAVLAMVLNVADLGGQTLPISEYDAVILHPRTGFNHSAATAINLGTHEVVGLAWHQTPGDGHALVWTGAGTRAISLNPGTRFGSFGAGVDGTTVGGSVTTLAVRDSVQATMWDMYARTSVTLHPAGMAVSAIEDAGGGQLVGWVGGEPTRWAQHAALWIRSEMNAFVDLNPTHFLFSTANAVDAHGRQQVGSGDLNLGNDPERTGLHLQTETHALLWTGTAGSAVDLHPSGFGASRAFGVGDSQQVGWGIPTGTTVKRALLWSGSAGSVIDLHPPGFTESVGHSAQNRIQVGAGYGPSTGGEPHALLWFGRPDTMVDLHSFLQSGVYASSEALDLDEYGNAVGLATTPAGHTHAVIWRRRANLYNSWTPGLSRIRGGQDAPWLVLLDIPAHEDACVEMVSSEPAIAVVPVRRFTAVANCEGTIVPSGSQTAEDGLWLTPVSSSTPITITSSYRNVSVSASFTVIPAALASVGMSPWMIQCGQSTTATVILNGPAGPAGALVQLASTRRAVSLPTSVMVAPYSDRATFLVSTAWLPPSQTPGSITDTVVATHQRVKVQASLKCIY